MDPLPQVRLKIERRSSHPWIFQKMVEKPATRVGDRASSTSSTAPALGRPRLLQRPFAHHPSRPDRPIRTKRSTPRSSRAASAGPSRSAATWLGLDAVTDAYRLVHSEGDGLSGLVVDRFGGVLVMEFFAAGMYRFREAILRSAAQALPRQPKFYWFAEEHVQKQESFDCRAPEPPPPGVITEHGVRFRVAAGSKHKTGFFLDQRDNRRALADVLRRQARARPVLQHGGLRGVRQGARAAPRR